MVHGRHPKVANVRALGLEHEAPVETSRLWWSVNTPLRPSISKDPHGKPSQEEPGPPRVPWTRTTPATRRVLSSLSNVVLPELGDGEKAQMLSQSGPFSNTPFIVFPTNRLTRYLRRLPLPLATRSCRCGRPRRLEARVTLWRVPLPAYTRKEGPGSRPTSWSEIWTSQRTTRPTADAWKSLPTACRSTEVRSSRLTPRWSALFDATEPPRATRVPGAALEDARRRKERTYPELAGERGRARLVLAGEVGGRSSAETRHFIGALAKDKALFAPLALS